MPNYKTNWNYIFIIFIIAVLAEVAICGVFNQQNFQAPKIFLKNIDISHDKEISIPYGKEKEYRDNVLLVKTIDKQLLEEQIEKSKEFLFGMMEPENQGFYKYYYAEEDRFEPRLYGPYTASIIYTFLYIYDLFPDEELLEYIKKGSEFLLSLQNKDQSSIHFGAIHYSYYLATGQKEDRFVSGTAGLSIFTLLRLYELLGEEKYIKAAKSAGDWLISMQREDGVIKPYSELKENSWVFGSQESLLYNGQVLSGLSKLYLTTQEEKYRKAAGRIADNFASKFEKEKGYVEDEYRDKNPISNAWVVMSLMDYYKADPQERWLRVIFPLSELILENQKNDPNDLVFYGSWGGAYSSSGMGWLSEVMVEVFRFCKEIRPESPDCLKYKEAAIKVFRWLVQSTYTEENSAGLPNPARVLGGVFWSKSAKYVRTDSVCHAANSYSRMFSELENDILLSVED